MAITRISIEVVEAPFRATPTSLTPPLDRLFLSVKFEGLWC